MRHLIVVLGLTLNVYRCSLARATGPFSSNGSFFLVQRERQAVSETESLKKHASSSFIRHHVTLEFNSDTSRAFYTANLKNWEII